MQRCEPRPRVYEQHRSGLACCAQVEILQQKHYRQGYQRGRADYGHGAYLTHVAAESYSRKHQQRDDYKVD